MCTSVSYKTKHHYFGRNLDLEHSYHETVAVTPRSKEFVFRHVDAIPTHHAMIGMAFVLDDYPLYYEATNEKGLSTETFSLSRVRRYYETGVKSLLGEALIEYGFPTDAIRRIEENHKKIKSMTASEAKEYCRLHFREVQLLLDTYERSLFIKAMRTF